MAALLAVLALILSSAYLSEAKFSFSTGSFSSFNLEKKLGATIIKATTPAAAPASTPPYNPCVPIKGKGGHGPKVGRHPPGVGGHPCSGKNAGGFGAGGGKGIRRKPPPPSPPPPFSRPPTVGNHIPNTFNIRPINRKTRRCNRRPGFCSSNNYHVSRNETTCCRKRCVDITQDTIHCGGCFKLCRDPGLLCCSSACIDSRTDEGNCGACGNACLPGETCVSGVCSYGSV